MSTVFVLSTADDEGFIVVRGAFSSRAKAEAERDALAHYNYECAIEEFTLDAAVEIEERKR